MRAYIWVGALTPIMYSAKARDLRRCTYRYPDGHERAGERCRAYAMWESAWREGNGLCVAHGGHTRGPDREGMRVYRTIPKCHCEAYNWPHRPGGGCCEWPDDPEYVCTVPEGTHAEFRYRGASFLDHFCEIRRNVVDATPP